MECGWSADGVRMECGWTVHRSTYHVGHVNLNNPHPSPTTTPSLLDGLHHRVTSMFLRAGRNFF
jgi:hypothetical protein